MRYISSLLIGAFIHTASVYALPLPQYAPQNMDYNYPMYNPQMMYNNGNNGMMNNGGGMMYNNGMMNSNGMMNNRGGMMYNNGSGMNNQPIGRSSSPSSSSKARGQRYHAHAAVNDWPIPKNPYNKARANRHPSHAALYAADAMAGPNPMNPPAHNRIPMDADTDDTDDDEPKNKDKVSISGVRRAEKSVLSMEAAMASDPNTSINVEALSTRIINVDAFDSGSIKPAASSSSTQSGSASSSDTLLPTTNASAAPSAASTATGTVKQTITRSIVASKPTATKSAAVQRMATKTAKGILTKGIAHDSAGGKHQSTRVAAANSTSSHLRATSTNTAVAPKTATRKEPSMKNIRGL
ncbi:hypothetical protein GGF37_002978 [Kickxella alabastrina]|nr:hypothetical protein GGF37_002978 [Kickxella alabastrina]